MDKKSDFDSAVDILKERLLDASKLVHERYKGVRPFRVSLPTKRERLYKYLQMTPEQREFGRSSFGESYDTYENQMEQLKKEFGVTEDYNG